MTRGFWGVRGVWDPSLLSRDTGAVCKNLFGETRRILQSRSVRLPRKVTSPKIHFSISHSENLIFRPDQGRGNSRCIYLRASGGRAGGRAATTQDHGLPGQVPSPHAPRRNISRSGVPFTPTTYTPLPPQSDRREGIYRRYTGSFF